MNEVERGQVGVEDLFVSEMRFQMAKILPQLKSAKEKTAVSQWSVSDGVQTGAQ